MTDEQETFVPTELDNEPAIETASEPEEQPISLEDLAASEDEGEGDVGEESIEAPEIEYITLERNGKQYQVPKELEAEFLMQSDYTRKTQATAELAKELKAREERIAQQAQATEEELRDRATLVQVDAELSKYKDVNWLEWSRQDPVGAQEHKFYYDQLTAQKAEAEGRVTKMQTERSAKAQQDFAKRMQETREFAQTIPGWSPEVDAKLQAFAGKEGLDPEFLRDNLNPKLYGILHKAWLGDQALAKQSAKPAPKPGTVQPLQKVTARGNPQATPSISELAKSGNMEAYIRAREAQQAHRKR